jgi:hypothetical protein
VVRAPEVIRRERPEERCLEEWRPEERRPSVRRVEPCSRERLTVWPLPAPASLWRASAERVAVWRAAWPVATIVPKSCV